jgi:hypothetical protein
MGEMKKSYKILDGKSEGKRPHAKLRGRWENNIKINIRVMVNKGADWIHAFQDRHQR